MKAVPLAVAGAFHTPIMASAVQRLREALAETRIERPTIPVISNVDARPHFEPDEIRELLVRQLVSPVRWEESMRTLLDEEYDQFYEVGPGRVLRGLLNGSSGAFPATARSIETTGRRSPREVCDSPAGHFRLGWPLARCTGGETHGGFRSHETFFSR